MSSRQNREKEGIFLEPFQPESVLTFLHHLGVTRHEVHKKIGDTLRTSLEVEIDRIDISNSRCAEGNKKALFDLLQSSWNFISVPELRPVVISLIKKLGDQTPAEVLTVLAKKEEGGELKYGELLQQFGLNMRRLVWEADWNALFRGDGSAKIESPSCSNILMDMARPAIEEYVKDDSLVSAANLAFPGSIREKKLATQNRRSTTADGKSRSGGNLMSGGTLSVLTSSGDAGEEGSANSKEESESKTSSGTGLAKLKSIMGSRPKLLAAIINILIMNHGQHDSKVNTILGGAEFLSCTLLADLLLSYGHTLPRQYEHVHILASVLDNSVKIGMISDQAIAQIQGCIKAIFQPSQEKEKIAVVEKDSMKIKKIVAKSKPASKKATKSSTQVPVTTNETETKFERKTLRTVVKAAVKAMRQLDPQQLFFSPVTDKIAPGYSNVIKKPMCIQTIEEKAIQMKYSSLAQFEADVQLMYRNCIAYNIGRDGQWFRGETRRQEKKCKDEVLPPARKFYKDEMSKRKKVVKNAEARADKNSVMEKSKEDDKKRKHDSLLAQQHRIFKNVADKGKKSVRSNSDFDDGVIDKLSAIDISPLHASNAKRRKKDTDFPSMPCIASMLLSDPFVIRLLLDKLLRTIKNDVLKKDEIPAGHNTIPSVLQILHLSQESTHLCALKGTTFFVPHAGLTDVPHNMDDLDSHTPNLFFALRKFTTLLAKLMLQVELDRRLSTGGDLEQLSTYNEDDAVEWENSSSYCVVRALVEGSTCNLFLPAVSNDAALLVQYPRYLNAISHLAGGNMRHERPFFISLIHALLRHKSKLPHRIRDMVVNSWLEWFTLADGVGIMIYPVHECFVQLLNEVSLMQLAFFRALIFT
jgi:hypothetical protein